LSKSSPGQAGKAPVNKSAAISRTLIYENQADVQIPVLICKKGKLNPDIFVKFCLAKKSGKNLVRNGLISRADVFRFVQSNKKTFNTPLDFAGETRVRPLALKNLF